LIGSKKELDFSIEYAEKKEATIPKMVTLRKLRTMLNVGTQTGPDL